jgi:hypothetical protein
VLVKNNKKATRSSSVVPPDTKKMACQVMGQHGNSQDGWRQGFVFH